MSQVIPRISARSHVVALIEMHECSEYNCDDHKIEPQLSARSQPTAYTLRSGVESRVWSNRAPQLTPPNGADRDTNSYTPDTRLPLTDPQQSMPPKKKVLSPEEQLAAKIDAFKERAARAIRMQEYHDAVEAMTEAIKLQPTNHTLYANRSLARLKLANAQLAFEDAKKAIELKPDWAKGYFRVGQASEALIQYAEAAQYYRKAVELDASEADFKAALDEVTSILAELSLGEGKSDEENPDSDKFDALVQWLREGGARFPKLYMKYYSQDYRGVHALTRINNNEQILYVPLKYIMTSEVAKASDIGTQIIESGYELRSKHSYLACYLLRQRSMGTSSFWEPYIRILPVHFRNMPIFFTEDELDWLTGSFTLYKIGDRIDSLRREYDALRRVVPLFKPFSYEEFVWARLVVITRIFGIEVGTLKTDGLVPYADMLNHKIPRETKWCYDNDMQGFVITSLKALQRGEEIFDSYGHKCNNRFFINYGFALDENPENEVVIRLELNPRVPGYRFKCDLLGGRFENGIRREYQIPATYVSEKTQEMFSFLRLVHAPESEIINLIDASGKVKTNPETKGLDIKPISIANEIKVLKTIADACKVVLDRFPTTLEDDEKLLQSGTLAPYSNERNCVVQRVGEKRVLKWFIELAAKNIPLLQSDWATVKKIAMGSIRDGYHKDFYLAQVVAKLVEAGK